MADNIEVKIDVDDSELQEAEKDIDSFKKKSDRILEESDKKTKESFKKCLQLARGTYLIAMGMLKASGQSISYFFRAAVSAVFGAAEMLYPMFAAIKAGGLATLNPFMVIQSVIGMTQLGVSIGAAVSAESQHARNLRGIDMALHGIQNLIGDFYFMSE